MSVTAPKGFRAAGVTAGLKPSGKPDVALVVNDGPSDSAAAVFTANRCKANPVLWSEQACADGRVAAVVLNAGSANCYTGPEGFLTTHASAEKVADLLGVSAADVAVCSTGLIGEPLDAGTLLPGIENAHRELDANGGLTAAGAIMTTDSVPKQVVRHGDGWVIGGMAKGAGMLAPSLATMLVVLTTDAVLDGPWADAALRAATAGTFDRLDSDGCMSTNDTVLLMASGASGRTPDADQFAEALHEACRDLALALLADAEGSEHEIAITVLHAVGDSDAIQVGRSIARSNLFKTAIFGQDPNWGRVLAAIGTTTAEFDPTELDVTINGVRVCADGRRDEPATKVDLSGRKVELTVDLKAGESSATIWTNDLTHAYVHENSAYST